MPTSQEILEDTNSRLQLRVRMWKDANGAALSPTITCSNTKLSLTEPTWVKSFSVRFSTAPYFFRFEASDHGAFSILATDCNLGSSVCRVTYSTGFQAGRKIILRTTGGTDKFTITKVEDAGGGMADITFDGQTSRNYPAAGQSTAEDDRWYQVARGYCGDTITTLTFGGFADDVPMIAAYGQYFRVVSDSVAFLPAQTFTIIEDDYFDISDYLIGPIDISSSVDIVKSSTTLTEVTMRLNNEEDRFNRRNAGSPYIDSGINYLERPCRVTVEYLGLASDWQQGVNDSDLPDWQLLVSFTAQRWSITYGEQSEATLTGEALHRLTTEIDIPLTEIKGVRELIKDWVVVSDCRLNLALTEGDPAKYQIAVVEDDPLERTNTSFNEIIGRGTFGLARELYFDSGEKQDDGTPLLYGGYFGMATDGKFIYTAHSLEKDSEGNYSRGVIIAKRYMNCLPTGDLAYFFESTWDDIDEGDICIAGGYMWLHTGQINVTKNVYKIDMSGTINDWTVTTSYAKKGGAGHIPVHAVASSDGNSLYVLYDGGAEGKVLYKVSTADYSTTWSFSFNATQTNMTSFGLAGMIRIGSELFIFSKADGSLDPPFQRGRYHAVIWTLSDTPAYLTFSRLLQLDSKTGIFGEVAEDNQFGHASIILTNAGMFSLTGQNADAFRNGVFCDIGRVKFYLQNGRVVNDADAYEDPRADKDAANYDLEVLSSDGEVFDNTGTYDGVIKTTDDYSINLLTGEILFLMPPRRGAIVRASYDYKPSVQYFSQEQVERWESIRQLGEIAGMVVYTTPAERIAYKSTRRQEDYVFLPDLSGQIVALKGRNIIHDSNPAYDHNTVQVANGEHNYFYVEGTHYTIAYVAATGRYTLTEVGDTMEGHVVVTYLAGPEDDSLPIYTGESLYPTNIMSASDAWDFADVYNQVIFQGERAFPSDAPTVIIETIAVSPKMLNIDQKWSKVQKAVAQGQYAWDGEQKIFLSDSDEDQYAAGFVVEFTDPMIIGTTEWKIKGPDTSQVETDTESHGGGAYWYKFEWGSSFYEPNSAVETIDYDVMVTNPDYWRVAKPDDTQDIRDQESDQTEQYKGGGYIWIKKFRDDTGSGVSDDCTAYAYKLTETVYYIDKAGRLVAGSLADADNPSPSASPDKSIDITLEPLDARDVHLFSAPGTYDSVVVGDEYCMDIAAVRIKNDGISADVYNYASDTQFIRITVAGYPIVNIEKVQVKAEDRIRLDAATSSIQEMGEKPLVIQNPFCQSQGITKTLALILLDWCKRVHQTTSLDTKFNTKLNLLSQCLIENQYGNYDKETELWTVIGIQHSIQNGHSNMSMTRLQLIDPPDNPSVPAPGS